jgi:accessory colonization factor AcfC
MNKHGHAPIGSVLVMAALLALPSASFAQVKVITSGGFAAALKEILPEFEKATGITITTTHGPSQGNWPNFPSLSNVWNGVEDKKWR